MDAPPGGTPADNKTYLQQGSQTNDSSLVSRRHGNILGRATCLRIPTTGTNSTYHSDNQTDQQPIASFGCALLAGKDLVPRACNANKENNSKTPKLAKPSTSMQSHQNLGPSELN